MTGVVWDIRKYSLHDGPGIRTTVFLKGCPLACSWCCNPESQDGHPQITWFREKCLSCGTCVEVCARDAVLVDRSKRRRIDRASCDLCGECVTRCAAGAMVLVGRRMTVDEVLREVGQDAIFYSRSGGGLTLSGGEPLAQPAFAAELLRRYKSDYVGVHTTVETCGEAAWEDVALLAPHVDLFLYDIKHMDAFEHRRLTGAGNERILENAARLAASGAALVVRLPLLPGHNDDEDNLRRSAGFARSVLRVDRVDLLPYHRLGEPKYPRLGRRYHLAGTAAASDTDVAAARQVLERCGMRVQVGG
jgi:pyruvate formate lyase activating enzyme